jgi:hypothetical protein
MREIEIERTNFEFLSLKFDIFWETSWLPIYLLDFCCFFCFGTGADWLSICAISASTESALENGTSTSTSTLTSISKMISGLKKSVSVPVD